MIQRRVEHPVSRQVPAGAFREGDTEGVGVASGDSTFAKVEAAAAVA